MSDSQNPAPPNPPSAPPPPPAAPPPASPPPPSGPRLPWVERERLGFVPAFVETAKLIVQQPAEAFSRIRADGDYVSPLLFGGIVSMAALVVNILVTVGWGMLFSGASGGVGAAAIVGGIGMVMTIVLLIVAPILIVIGMFILAGIFHAVLSLSGGLASSATGFEGSLKLVAYASLSAVLGIVPIVGPLLQLGALGYLCYIGLPKVHRCDDRQTLYALSPLIVCGGCGVLGMIFNTLRAMF